MSLSRNNPIQNRRLNCKIRFDQQKPTNKNGLGTTTNEISTAKMERV
jgi:hypothetical protein